MENEEYEKENEMEESTSESVTQNNTETSTQTSNTEETTTSTTTDTTTSTQSEASTTSTTTSQNTETSTSSETTSSSSETTSTGTETTTPTASNTSTNQQPQMKIKADGKMEYDGQVMTNEKLQEYFDYNSYTNETDKKMVEGIFSSNNVTINGVTYKAELNENGEMVSVDGKSVLKKEEIKAYLGDKGYEALVCKSTKDVKIEDGKIIITDRAEEVKINIEEDKEEEKEEEKTSNNSSEETEKEDVFKKASSSKSSGYSGGGGGGGYSGGGGGYSGGGGGYSGGGGGSSSSGSIEEPNPYGFKTGTKGNSVIKVEFEQLSSIRDELSALRGQVGTISDDYSNTINGLGGNGDAWSGVDKEKYISQKKGYATNMGEIDSVLNEFVSYLDTCLTNYQQLESELAAKQIS